MTGNVTWLSPAACDPGKRAADVPQGTRSGGQAMRVLVTGDDEILATAVAAGLRRKGMAVDVTLDGAMALELYPTLTTSSGAERSRARGQGPLELTDIVDIWGL